MDNIGTASHCPHCNLHKHTHTHRNTHILCWTDLLVHAHSLWCSWGRLLRMRMKSWDACSRVSLLLCAVMKSPQWEPRQQLHALIKSIYQWISHMEIMLHLIHSAAWTILSIDFSCLLMHQPAYEASAKVFVQYVILYCFPFSFPLSCWDSNTGHLCKHIHHWFPSALQVMCWSHINSVAIW